MSGPPRRVFLTRPAWGPLGLRTENTYNRTWPPLSGLYIATRLRERGIDTRILDFPAVRQAPELALSGLGKEDLVFLSTADVDRWQCPNVEMTPVHRLAAALRETGARFWLTGPHGTVAPEMLIQRTGAEGAVLGEPEEACVALATGTPLESIPGLACREGISTTWTRPAVPVDMARLPVPDYSLLDLSRYRYELLGERFALFEGVRGCPYPCTFCSRVVQGHSVRRKAPDQLIAEVERAVRRDGVRSAYFIDLEFSLGGATNRALCEFLAKERLPLAWCCQLRPREVGEDLIDAMAAGGCRLVHCGIESGSSERLRGLDKLSTVEELVGGVQRILRRGMDVLCFFILGFPGESEAEIEQTVRLAMDLDPTYASFHFFTPYPGTEQSVAAQDGPLFVPPTHPQALPFERLARIRRRALMRFYLRPGYVMSRLRRRQYRLLLQQVRIFASQLLS